MASFEQYLSSKNPNLMELAKLLGGGQDPRDLATIAQPQVNDVAIQPAIQPNEPMPEASPPVPETPQDPNSLATILSMMSRPKDQAALNAVKQGIEDQKQNALLSTGAMQAQNALPNQLNLSPLNALVDQWTGSNLSKGYQAPQSPEDRNLMMAKLQQMAQGDKKGITEELVKYAGMTDKPMPGIGALLGATARTKGMGEIAQQNRDQTAYNKIIDKVDKDPLIKQRITQSQNLKNSLSLIMNADKLKPQQFHEAQQTVRANLGIKGSSGVSERERTMLDDLGIRADAFEQFLGLKDADISKDNPLVKHVVNLAQLEMGNAQNQLDSRINSVTAGYEDILARHPEWQKNLMKKLALTRGQLSNPVSATSAGSAPQAQPGMKVLRRQKPDGTYEYKQVPQ